MNKFKNGLLVGGFIAALATPIYPALAEDTTVAPAANSAIDADASANIGISAVDAGKLIGEDVVDGNGDTVGEIESVIVDTKGKVTSVVLDVGGWLEAEKRISVAWSDLKTDADGNVRTSITKDAAQAATDYKYSADVNRGKVLNETGQVYAADGTQLPATTSKSDNAVNAGADMNTNTANASRTVDLPALNADGSFNASKVVGLNVVNNANDTVGEISEVLLDDSGKVSGVIVDVGGFLGIATHPVKLGWNQIKMMTKDGELQAVVNMDKNALQQMPEYKATNG